MKQVQLPDALVRSEEFSMLDEGKQQSLRTRIAYLGRIPPRIAEMGDGIANDFVSITEDLKLDCATHFSTSEHQTRFTFWEVQTRWRDAVSRSTLQKFGRTHQVLFKSKDFALLAEGSGEWLVDFGKSFERILEHFESSSSFEEAVCWLMFIDLAMSKLLHGLLLVQFV